METACEVNYGVFPGLSSPLWRLYQGASLEKGKAVILGNFQFLSPFFMSFRTFISPPHPNYRYSQASYRGSFCHAWWVWAAKPGEALRDYIKQRGCLECGNSGGGRQEDAGETWQRQRHYLCPYCHEHGEQSYQQHCCGEDTLFTSTFASTYSNVQSVFLLNRSPVYSKMELLEIISTLLWLASSYLRKIR